MSKPHNKVRWVVTRLHILNVTRHRKRWFILENGKHFFIRKKFCLECDYFTASSHFLEDNFFFQKKEVWNICAAPKHLFTFLTVLIAVFQCFVNKHWEIQVKFTYWLQPTWLYSKLSIYFTILSNNFKLKIAIDIF